MKKQILIISLMLLISGCADSKMKTCLQEYSESRPLFGTMIRLDACYEGTDGAQLRFAFSKAWERLEEMQWRMNIDDERSDIAKINRSKGRPVAVGADTYQLLKDSVAITRLTEGAFDVTIYPLLRLWKESEENHRSPSSEDLVKVKEVMGVSKIEFLVNNRLRLLDPKTQIDVNGIAAGYGADEAARILRENGINNFLVDTGGELAASGKNCRKMPWRIGIRDPRETSRLIGAIYLSQGAVSTSGNYEKYFLINGEKKSHILNPLTGYPAEMASATVVAPTGKIADALSTALCVMGAKKGIALIDSLGPGYAAIVMELKNARLTFSSSKEYRRYKAVW